MKKVRRKRYQVVYNLGEGTPPVIMGVYLAYSYGDVLAQIQPAFQTIRDASCVKLTIFPYRENPPQ